MEARSRRVLGSILAPSRAVLAGWAIVATILLVLVTAHALVLSIAPPAYRAVCSLKVPFRVIAHVVPRVLGGERTWSSDACAVTDGRANGSVRIDPSTDVVTVTLSEPFSAEGRALLARQVPVLTVETSRPDPLVEHREPLLLRALDALTPLADVPDDGTGHSVPVTRVRATSVSDDGTQASWTLDSGAHLDEAVGASVSWVDPALLDVSPSARRSPRASR